MPVGVYGGKAEPMNQVAPEGPVYQAGTLSGNPVAMAAGMATLKKLSCPGVYEELEIASSFVEEGINAAIKRTRRRCGFPKGWRHRYAVFPEKPGHELLGLPDQRYPTISKVFLVHGPKRRVPAAVQFESWFFSTALNRDDLKRGGRGCRGKPERNPLNRLVFKPFVCFFGLNLGFYEESGRYFFLCAAC